LLIAVAIVFDGAPSLVVAAVRASIDSPIITDGMIRKVTGTRAETV
jgi:hypothetical protein